MAGMPEANQEIEITTDQIAEWCPMIATPCYDRQLSEPYFMSIMNMAMLFNSIELRFGVSTISDSLVTRARNNLVAKFMSTPEFTHLMFIDADIGFEAEDILKLLWHDKDVITGSYPVKDINWTKVIDNVHKGVEEDLLFSSSLRYVVNPVQGGSGEVSVLNGAIKIHDAGTGFMMIKKSAIQQMIDAYPDRRFLDDTAALSEEEKKWTYHLFDDYIDPDTKRLLSEDYGFCRLWQDIGGDVWVDPVIKLTHLGRMAFTGQMVNYLDTVVQGEPLDLTIESEFESEEE